MKDQLNREVVIPEIPKRIVSLVPSQTEFLFDLGLEDEVIGITKFCIHPKVWFANKKKVGGTKNVHIQSVQELSPDLIIANKEENTKGDIMSLESLCNVWVSDIRTFEDALQMMRSVSEMVNRKKEAMQIIEQLETNRNIFLAKQKKRSTAIYLIWKNPMMVAGTDTFIHEMMNLAGFDNSMKENRYPIVEVSELIEMAPECILLSSEPYPFKQKDVDELQALLPHSKVFLVDGELFSWYGSRLLKSFDYFSALHEQIN